MTRARAGHFVALDAFVMAFLFVRATSSLFHACDAVRPHLVNHLLVQLPCEEGLEGIDDPRNLLPRTVVPDRPVNLGKEPIDYLLLCHCSDTPTCFFCLSTHQSIKTAREPIPREQTNVLDFNPCDILLLR